jgi:hypothetical protein
MSNPQGNDRKSIIYGVVLADALASFIADDDNEGVLFGSSSWLLHSHRSDENVEAQISKELITGLVSFHNSF